MPKMAGFGEWASELAKAFGENPNEVRSIVLRCVVDEAVTVTIEKFVDSGNTKLLQAIKKVVWVADEVAPTTTFTTEFYTHIPTPKKD